MNKKYKLYENISIFKLSDSLLKSPLTIGITMLFISYESSFSIRYVLLYMIMLMVIFLIKKENYIEPTQSDINMIFKKHIKHLIVMSFIVTGVILYIKNIDMVSVIIFCKKILILLNISYCTSICRFKSCELLGRIFR